MERKYVLTKIAAGDYALPSNDGKTIWRIARYEDGPSHGLDWPRDRVIWGVWKYLGHDIPTLYGEICDWENWSYWGGHYETRNDAIKAAID